jgi:hypothetical protein
MRVKISMEILTSNLSDFPPSHIAPEGSLNAHYQVNLVDNLPRLVGRSNVDFYETILAIRGQAPAIISHFKY